MKKIGKYEIFEILGKGGMGVVYKGFDPLLQREVAIKVISESAFDNPDIKERFFREARAAVKLLHENIIVVHDLGEHEGKPYIVMEYLTGADLRAILNTIKANDREPLLLQQKLDFAWQICKGFDFLHAKDIIHRDLKPENIRVLDNGSVKIMDFGIAKSMMMATTMTQAGVVLGTPSYMSPEQIRGQKVDKRSDIFSFGILFYELLTYKMPFKGENFTSICYNIVYEPPDQIDDLEIENLAPAREIILKALKKDVRERYQSFSELITDLETVIRIKETELRRLVEGKRKKLEKLLADSNNFLKKKNFLKALEKAQEAGKISTNAQNIRELIALIKEDEEKENRRLGDAKTKSTQGMKPSETIVGKEADEETKAISIEVAETELVKTKPAVKKTPRLLAKAPFQFKRTYAITAAAALLLSAVLIYRVFIYTPSSPSGYVALNILPWAEVVKIETSDGRDVTAIYAAAGKIVTPCRLVLPEGSFKISLTNSVLKESLTLSVAVKPGDSQEVKHKMPGFNYNNLLPRF